MRHIGAALAALAIVACGEERADRVHRWEAAIDTVGDTITIRTTAGSVWGDTAVLEREVSVGVMEGEDPYLIGEPQSLAVAGNGTIYLLDTQVPVVRAYDAGGRHLRDVGRKGGGPGEYQNPDGMAVLPDDRVLVLDPGGARIVVYDPAGTFIEQWPLSGGFNTSRPLYVDTAGRVYTSVLTNPGTPPWEWIMGLRWYGPDGTPGDTIFAPTWDFEPAVVTASREGSSSSSTVPFTAQRSWTFSPFGYTVGGLSTAYRIDLYRMDAPVLRIERDWDPVPVHPDEAAERRDVYTERFQRSYGSWRWNGPPIPDTKPPFQDLFTSLEGNVWVQVSQPGRPVMTPEEAREEQARTGRQPYRYREPAAFDVFTPDGRFLGHVVVPESFRTDPQPIARGDTVWAVTRDELDVARIVRFRMVHPDGT